MKKQTTKELGKNNYKLLGAAIVLWIASIPIGIYSIKSGAVTIIVGTVLFLLAMIRPAKQEKSEVNGTVPSAETVPASSASGTVRKPLPVRLNVADGSFERRYYYSKVEFDKENSLPTLSRGKTVELKSEGEDVIVETDGVKLGMMRTNNLRQMVKDWEKKNAPVLAQIDTEDPISLELALYSMPGEQADYEERGIPSNEFKLSGVNTGDYSFMSSVAEVGDLVDVTYDPAKERYETCYGYLPKAADDFLDNDTVGFVSFVEEDEDEKYTIKVRVYEEKIWK